MTARTLLADLRRRGVTLAAVDGRLRFHPREAVTRADLDRLRDHKDDLLELLTPRLLCPWCRSTDLAEGASGRLWCERCERPAWLPTPAGGIIRADQDVGDLWQ